LKPGDKLIGTPEGFLLYLSEKMAINKKAVTAILEKLGIK